MSYKGTSVYDDVKFILEQDNRGVKLGIYSLATLGLAVAIHRVRPISKYSRGSQVPLHFIRENETLAGRIVGVQPAPMRILVDHRAPIYLPFWHSRKPPLPVQLWGIEIADGNAIGWLQCIATGNKAYMKPVSRSNDNLYCNIELHLKDNKSKKTEVLNLGQKLVELGFAKVTVNKPIKKKPQSLESVCASTLVSAEAKAKSRRSGVWSKLPPPPFLVVVFKQASSKVTEMLASGVKYALSSAWRYIRPASKKTIKQNMV